MYKLIEKIQRKLDKNYAKEQAKREAWRIKKMSLFDAYMRDEITQAEYEAEVQKRFEEVMNVIK